MHPIATQSLRRCDGFAHWLVNVYGPLLPGTRNLHSALDKYGRFCDKTVLSYVYGKGRVHGSAIL